MRKLHFFGLVAVLALGAALFFIFWRGGAAAVAITAVTRGPAVQLVYATGVVEPVTQAAVSPEVNGRLTDFLVKENDTVKRGDVLARLYDAEQRAEVAELSTRVANDETTLKRDEDLFNRKVGSRENYDNSKAALEQSKAKLAAAQARLEQRQIKAPLDGVVIRREREIGETVTPGSVLFVLAAPQPLRVAMEIDEEDIPQIKLGQKVLLSNDAFPEQVFTAEVSELTPQGDSASKTYRVRAVLPEATPLPLGMSVEANVVLSERVEALLVPATSVRGESVFVLDGSHARLRKVKVGIIGVEKTEILDGLTERDRVVDSPPASLQDGARIRPVAAP